MEIKKHLKWIIPTAIIGTGVGVGIVVLCVAAKTSAPLPYSSDWIRRLSDEAWEQEREKVRLRYCSAGNTAEGGYLQRVLWLFDSVKREKDGPITGPMYPHSREHGWNLYKPD